MKIDLDKLKRSLEHIENGRYLSEYDRAALGARLIDAAPLLLEAFDVLVYEVAMGEVVQPTRSDGTPASDGLLAALKLAAVQILAYETPSAETTVEAVMDEMRATQRCGATGDILREAVPVGGLPAALYISLHSELPGARNDQSAHELSYPGYTRVGVARLPDGRWPEQIRIDFPSGTATCVARYFGIGICASGRGELLRAYGIHPHIHIDAVSSTTPILILPMRSIAEIDGYPAP